MHGRILALPRAEPFRPSPAPAVPTGNAWLSRRPERQRRPCRRGAGSILSPMASRDLVTELGRWLDELARKWERFFAHDPQVRVPPEREREALERRLRELSRQEPASPAEDFRVQQLLHRFSTHSALWQRQLRDREASRKGMTAPPAEINAARRAPVPPAEDEYATLHAAYVGALHAAGSAGTVSLDRFRDTLLAQRRVLEERGAVVEGFAVVKEGRQVRSRARVRRGRES